MPTNERDRLNRNNQGVLINGLSGAGKSRMGQELARDWARVVFIDPTNSFTAAYRARDYDDFVEMFRLHYHDSDGWTIAANFTEDGDYAKVFETLAKTIKLTEGNGHDFLIVVDEVDMFTGSNIYDIDENLRWIIKRGRHFGVSWIAICQADVDTNRAIRLNASEIIIFVQGTLSADLTRKLKSARALRKGGIPEPLELVKHGRNVRGNAVENTHFIAIPEPFGEWRQEWRALGQAEKGEPITTE